MNGNFNSRRIDLYKIKKKDNFKTDFKAVSEAIGTILLLAISVSLVGVLAVWVNTLPEPQETIEAELNSRL
ncbi:MAG: type IV pilin N-terminal domain-containing protein, partial [Thermoplasmata archaeon]|nr:type IV pilin N-terminal domain-containing protein [Thermoplasmata archaeon]